MYIVKDVIQHNRSHRYTMLKWITMQAPSTMLRNTVNQCFCVSSHQNVCASQVVKGIIDHVIQMHLLTLYMTRKPRLCYTVFHWSTSGQSYCRQVFLLNRGHIISEGQSALIGLICSSCQRFYVYKSSSILYRRAQFYLYPTI